MCFLHNAGELGQFIEKEHAMMRQRHLTRPGAMAAADQRLQGRRMVRIAEAAAPGETAVAGLAGQRAHHAGFQHLVGLAADVHRLQQGLNVIIRAAQIVAKHPDQEHVQLLIHSAALITGSPVLPTREGHDAFQLTPEEVETQTSDDFDLDNAAIPRPRF